MLRHILLNLVCGDPPSVTWFEHLTQGYDSRDRSLWLFAAHVSSTMACLMLSWHPSLQDSLTSALICAVLHTSLESPPAGCTREYASCALRETTLCASRESPVHHCPSLKAVLSSRLRDSTTAVVRCVVQHHRCGRCSRQDLLVFHLSFSLALLRKRCHPRMHLNSASTGLHPRAPARASLAVYADFLLNTARHPRSHSC